MTDKTPPSTTDLYRAVERRRGRRTDEVDQAERLARLGQWRSMPLTVGLAIVLLAGVWKVWDMRDKLAVEIRHEIEVHNRDTDAHKTRVGDVRAAWSKCLELQRRISALEVRTGELAERRTRRRR